MTCDDWSYGVTYLTSTALFVLAATSLSAHATLLILVGVAALLCLPMLLELLDTSESSRSAANQSPADVADVQQEVSNFAPIVYSDRYNITAGGLEKLHPFDSVKYRRVYERLRRDGVLAEQRCYEPRLASREDLLLVHSRVYLAKLHHALYLTTVVEVPVCCLPSWLLRKSVLEPMRLATGGSILAAQVALRRGYAINLSGGYHHASAESGGGFCALADITLCIEHARRAFPERVRKVMIVDLDAHQGNGHERDFLRDPNVFIVDAYNPSIYPGDRAAMSAIRIPVAVGHSCSDTQYLRLVRDALDRALEEFRPDLVVYNAGTDCMSGDPLGCMQLSHECIVARDELVFDKALRHPDGPFPLVMVLSGGYQDVNAPAIADSIANISDKFPFNEVFVR